MSPESQIRLGIYSHLAAAMVCEAFSLADRSLLISRAVSRFVYEGPLAILMVPALFASLICPLIVITGVMKIRNRPKAVTLALVSEAIVFWMWFAALTPAVQ